MNNAQLYFAIGVPVLAILVSTLVNVVQFSTMNARISHLDSRLDAGVDKLDARIDRLEAKFETRFDILVGKVIELDNRLTRLEERLSH